jgi:hypothetical protein
MNNEPAEHRNLKQDVGMEVWKFNLNVIYGFNVRCTKSHWGARSLGRQFGVISPLYEM